jgi:hypothetical protein
MALPLRVTFLLMKTHVAQMIAIITMVDSVMNESLLVAACRSVGFNYYSPKHK